MKQGLEWFIMNSKEGLLGSTLLVKENRRLNLHHIKRPNTKWLFAKFLSIAVKVVFVRLMLLGTGPLPDWLHNLAHSSTMVALDNFNDNLCL